MKQTPALEFTTALAQQKGKLHAMSECGPLSDDLQKILADFETAYVLTRRNAPPRGTTTAPEPSAKKKTAQEAFLHSLKKNKFLFLKEYPEYQIDLLQFSEYIVHLH